MDSDLKRYSHKYFEQILGHHHGIFGIIDTLQNDDFYQSRQRIFRFAEVFVFLEPSFKTELFEKLTHDCIALCYFIENFTSDSKQNEIYRYFQKYNPTSKTTHKDVKECFVQKFQSYEKEFKLLINTKLFYLDSYLWSRAKKFHKINSFLQIVGLSYTNSVLESEFQENSSFILSTNFNTALRDIFIKYSQSEIAQIKAQTFPECNNDNKAIEQLVCWKDKISFFKNMSDEDIKAVIKDVKFMRLDAHETVIEQGDTSQDIFFLMEGECRVWQGKKNLGKIKQKRLFGEMACVSNQPRTATIKTNKPSIVISFLLDIENFENNPCLFSRLFKNISIELVKKLNTMNENAKRY